MHKTLYIDADEEITSIIDRIRSEAASDIFLVIPKDAIITQGVINLKILKKEAEGLKKNVIISTSDPQAKKVIERLEIKTGAIPEKTDNTAMIDDRKKEEITEKASLDVTEKMTGAVAAKEIKKISQQNVGSDTFLDQSMESAGSKPTDNETPPEAKQPMDSSEKTGAAIGFGVGATAAVAATRMNDISPAQDNPPLSSPETRNIQNSAELKQDLYSQKRLPANERGASAPLSENTSPAQLDNSSVKNNDPANIKKAEEFFSSNEVSALEKERVGTNEEEIKKQKKSQKRPRKKILWGVVALAFIVAGITIYKAYDNYPKITAVIFPVKKEVVREIKIVAKEGQEGVNDSEKIIPAEAVELTIKKEVEFQATGETYGSDDGKAKGSVTIYNNFSTASQPLVETTRLLSKEGQLFRTRESVTVPGMKDDQAGKITVNIIADKPGEEYNLEATTFTIEGFKGSAKYEKFEAKSAEAMSGGGSPDPEKKAIMVTEADIKNARASTIESLDEVLEQEIAKQTEGKKVVIDSVERSIEKAASSHKEGDVATNFTYTVVQKVKAIAFSHKDIEQLVMTELSKEAGTGQALDPTIKITYKKGIADFNEKTLTLYVEAKAVSWAIIDENAIKQGIAGKSEEEIRTFLSNYKGLQKAEIVFIPPWLSIIPIDEDKITVEEKKVEEEV